MRTPIYIKGGMRCLFAFLLAATTTGMSLTSCVSDNDANEKSIYDYSDTDVKSYGDLFQVFWSVMNQRYCTLNEQSAVSSQTWDQVYKEYKPKFDALKTFQHTSAFTQQEIQEDNAKAKQYFQEIIDKIIDQHFYVKITLPVSHSSTETVRFNSTLRNKTEYFPLNAHWNHTRDQLNLDGTAFGEITSDGFCIMGGYLKEQPGTYYLGFNKFALYENCFHEYQKTYLPVNAASTYHLDASTISAKAKALITDAGKREKAEQQAAQLLTDMDSYLASDDAAKACEKMVAYSNQGDYSGLYALASEAYEKSPNLLKLLPVTSDASGMGEQIRQKLQGDALYQQMLSASGFASWYCQALADYLWHERELYAYWSDLKFTYNHLCVEGYRRLFLEPLAKGEIKKLILDFRGTYDVQERRVFGYLSERLFNVWLAKLFRENNGLKVNFLRRVFVLDTKSKYWVAERPETSKDIVSVVIASDNNYVPHLGALIASIIDNFSKERFLDMIILDEANYLYK